MDIKVAEKNLLDIKHIFDRSDINYFVWYGTLLGVYRNGGIIPYDHDVDILLYGEEKEKYKRLYFLFKRHGFTNYKLKDDGVDITSGIKRDGVIVDFYWYSLQGNKRVWRNCVIDVEVFEKASVINYLGEDWKIIDNTPKWLKYLYGDDWSVPTKGKSIVMPW